jgi:DNA-binding NarL/FixJ family response regulator
MYSVTHPIKVAIVEDNIQLRNMLENIFNESGKLKVVSMLNDCSQLVAEFREKQPQVVLMDIELKNNDSGIEAVKILRNYFPDVRVLMYTVFEDDDKIFESVCAGASGYLLKKTPPDEVITALIVLSEGGAPMSPGIANRTLELFREKINPSSAEYGLSNREKEILQFLSEGFSYQKIADKLFLSISTIRTHIMNIYEKLQVNSKVEAIHKIKGS